jgi:hypothetical protein
MRTLYWPILLLITTFSILPEIAILAQQNDFVFSKNTEEGLETNGIRAIALLRAPCDVQIRIILKTHSTEAGRIGKLEKRPPIWGFDDAVYFMATNSFCGLVELRDPKGNTISSLRPDLNSLNAYPDSYNLMSMHYLLMTQYTHYSGPPLPRTTELIPSFCITNLFKIKEAGEYQLMIWPKIYKRSATNDDVCERIDLPPVTIPIQLDGN